ncbi:MAG TPA: transglutaminase-like domain-containing protein [Chthoniobacterales bacterium]|nr:transglutaminase-like domain-containing protein [Chthoniobacterales bacterium]
MFQKDAIVRLLRDNDPATVTLLKAQLIDSGMEGAADLRDLLALDDAAVTAHVREVIEKIETDEAQDEMLLCAHLFPEHGDIEAAWWLLTLCFEPDAPIAKLRRRLDAWGRRLRMLVAKAGSARERLQALTTFLAEDLGFRGNAEEYYDPKNSLLSDVIETRLGIPISLAMLYVIVGRRANMQIDGINLPGHFIARYDRILFDPFHQGRILSRPDCEAILARQRLKTESSYFAPASPRLVLMRMLANLLFIFERAGEKQKHQLVMNWLKALDRD